MELRELLKMRKDSDIEIDIEEDEEVSKKKKGMPKGLKLALIAKLKKKHANQDDKKDE